MPDINGYDVDVILVDNKSPDDSVRVIKKWLDENAFENKIHLIQSETNSGFSAGNNIGVQYLNSKYYLLLNSDTLIRKGSIQILLETAGRNTEFGLFSPRLEWPDEYGQESCFRFHSPLSEFLSAAQTGFLDKLLSKYIVAYPVQNTLFQPDWTSFACVLVRNEVFQQIGLIDEGYFMYFEDAEFCYRAKKAGWRVLHNPEARVVHLRGGSSPVKSQTQLKKRVPKYFYESRTRFFYQTYGWFGLTAANLFWLAGRLISKTRQILGRKDKQAVKMQWLDIWTNWLTPLKAYTHPDSNK